MTFLQAAEAVLRAIGHPMKASDVAAIAQERGLIRTVGKTPGATMAAVLYAAVKARPNGPMPIHRVAEPGPTRARRGSVRWVWARRLVADLPTIVSYRLR